MPKCYSGKPRWRWAPHIHQNGTLRYRHDNLQFLFREGTWLHGFSSWYYCASVSIEWRISIPRISAGVGISVDPEANERPRCYRRWCTSLKYSFCRRYLSLHIKRVTLRGLSFAAGLPHRTEAQHNATTKKVPGQPLNVSSQRENM